MKRLICPSFFAIATFASLTAVVGADKIDSPVRDLMAQMSLDEKIGQMTQADMAAIKGHEADIQKYGLGSLLSGGSSDPSPDNTPTSWLNAINGYQAWALKSRLKIPLLYGIDAVHGNNNIIGATVFPHNIGLGATGNPKLVEQAEHITALETAGIGARWAFAPCIAVAQNERWGRTYESFSESTPLVAKLAGPAVRGFQGKQLSADSASVLACAKHFAGDGGTMNGVDQGNTVCDEATFRKIHVAAYRDAIKAGAGSIMVSYSSWNGVKMSGHKQMLTDVLKGELGFKGFLVSDWAAIDQISPDFKHDVEVSINAGLDMIMIPHGLGHANNYVEFIKDLKELVAEGKVPLARIDDAVRRILRVKFQMGLFESTAVDPALTAAIGSPEHRSVARECVRQSVVLLKNSNHTLPLSKNVKRLAVFGKAADDMGIQCGGWTIDWQGGIGNITSDGTSILSGIRDAVSAQTVVIFSKDGTDVGGCDAIIVVVGELPYAEMKGDRTNLDLSEADVELIATAKATGKPVVTVLISGRPLVLGSALENTDALLAAWLPGTEGNGVADVLFGDYKPTGKLPRTWPANNDQLSVAGGKSQKPQFPLGFGLKY